jgi:hypothetical protein
LVVALLLCSMARTGQAQVFGAVRVMVRDPQNLGVSGADVTIKAKNSAYSQTAKSNAQGDATFAAVPFGQYTVSIISGGFDPFTRAVEVISNTQTAVQARLSVAGLSQSVAVEAEIQTVNPESSVTETLTHREDIRLQPSADRSDSLAMITNNVPGTFVMHDHLHSRGGPSRTATWRRVARSSIRRTCPRSKASAAGWPRITATAATACSTSFRAAASRRTGSAR